MNTIEILLLQNEMTAEKRARVTAALAKLLERTQHSLADLLYERVSDGWPVRDAVAPEEDG